MSLPLSDIVQVDIAVAPTLDALAGFGEMLMLTNDPKDLEVITSIERMRKFGSLAEVQDAWKSNPSSQVILAAKSFYGQVPQPKDFTVGVMIGAASAGSLLGGLPASLAEIKEETSASFVLTVDGQEISAINVNMSTATSMEDVATKISAALVKPAEGSSKSTPATPLAICKFVGGRFVVTSLTSGLNSTVTPFSEDSVLGTKLGLTASTMVGVATGTAAAEKVDQALGACDNVSDTFVAVLLHKSLRDKEASISGANGAASWCQANNKIFLNTTNDIRVLGLPSEQEATEAYKVKQKSFGKTITTFARNLDEYPSASLFGRIATVNYEGTNTCITLKFKKLPGITALNLTKSQKKAMDNLRVGGFMDFGGNLMYAEARMADGGWLDTVHGLMWLEDRIKKGVFNLMYGTTTKIPYTDTGINMVVQKVTTALEQGVANGLIAPGKTPEGEFLPTGYKIIAKSSTEVAAEDKSNRLYRGITFVAVGAGALHGVIISGSFSE